MPAPSAEVFKLLHDYSRRIEWDTLLKEARLTRGNTEAGVGATSLCVGKPFFGIFGIETRYVTFDESHISAVTMINSPPFFASFAASIRHEDKRPGIQPHIQAPLHLQTSRSSLAAGADHAQSPQRGDCETPASFGRFP